MYATEAHWRAAEAAAEAAVAAAAAEAAGKMTPTLRAATSLVEARALAAERDAYGCAHLRPQAAAPSSNDAPSTSFFAWERAAAEAAEQLQSKGDLEGALHVLSAPLHRPPPERSAPLLRRRAALLLRLGRWEAALQSAEEAARAEPEHGAPQWLLDGRKGGRGDLAASVPSAAVLRADALLCLGRRNDAAAALGQALHLPGEPLARAAELLAHIRRADAEAEGDFDVAALKAEAAGPGGPRLSRRHADYFNPLIEVRSSTGDDAGASAAAASAASASDATPTAVPAAAASTPPKCSGRGVFARAAIPAGTLLIACKALVAVQSSEAAPGGAQLSLRDTIGHRRARSSAGGSGVDVRRGANATLPYAAARALAASPELGATLYSLSAGSAFDDEAVEDPTRVHLARIMGISSSSAFGLLPHDPAQGGGGLWAAAAMLNHSCIPSCTYDCVGDFMFVSTVRDVAPGEEVRLTPFIIEIDDPRFL